MGNFMVSPEGADEIRSYEGCVLKAYRCPAGVLTIGYGHTGPDVREGQEITHVEAERLFRGDLVKFEQGVSRNLTRTPTPGQFDAMVSLAYNIGLTSFISSGLRRKFNEGNVKEAAAEFVKWKKAGGVVNDGLLRRRALEIVRFCSR